jgi:hypothetical protein
MSNYFVKISTTSWERLADLQRLYHLDVVRQTARQPSEEVFEIDGLLSEDQIEQLRAAGYEISIVADAEQVARERLKQVGRGASEPETNGGEAE